MRAVFLDRDGVVVHDRGGATRELQILDGAAEALRLLSQHGYGLVLVTNQPVVARGLIDEAGLDKLHHSLGERLIALGAPRFDGIFYCPHHPQASLPRYRMECDCRKPKPGLLLKAASMLAIDLSHSWMVGDRASDIAAGRAAGCQTVLVQSGRHLDPPIVGAEDLGERGAPHQVAENLLQASQLIVRATT